MAAGAVCDLRATAAAPCLSNEDLSVDFFPDVPVVQTYLHKPTGMKFGGGNQAGTLALNGNSTPWSKWQIAVDTGLLPNAVRYHLKLDAPRVEMRFDYRLQKYVLELDVEVLSDPSRWLRTIEWQDLPVLTCQAPDITIWREEWKERSWEEKIARGLWWSELVEKAASQFGLDAEPLSTMYCCFYRPDKLCAAVATNYPYMPIRNQIAKDRDGTKSYLLGLNTYQYRVRDRTMAPLRAKIAFLPDLNGDGRADASDFQLWVNRQLGKPLPTHRNVIWYKIFCAEVNKPPHSTFAQAGEIIERVHRYTDGLPQIVYLVGWQYQGHDTGYPSLDKVNSALGSGDDLARLHRMAKERWNTVVSYHINLDDDYIDHPGWDPSIIARQPDGALERWEVFNGNQSYHISHTKDVESRKVFARLAAMMQIVPLEKAIHLDAFRNMNWSWEPDGFIGAIEEFECGVKPIVQFFKSRGIDVTIESTDFGPTEWCGTVSGVWHLADADEMVQLRHGKMLGGGRNGDRGLWNYAFGSAISDDVLYSVDGVDYITRGTWDLLLDDIYLGVLLYHFYLEREMTALHLDKQGARLQFSDGVTTVASRDGKEMRVTQGDVVIALNYDRFIPRDEFIYAYSRDGSDRTWMLPKSFRNRELEIRTLGDSAAAVIRQSATDHLHLELAPRTPVKISRT
jgi:hypothetical protein